MTTPDLDHERIEALIAADVLDGLDEPDRREMEALLSEHGPDCEACRRLLVEYGDVAGGLALALDPVPMPAGVEERLMAAARATPQQAGSGPTSASAATARGTGARSVPRIGRTGRWLAGVAAAACLLLVAGLIGYHLGQSPAVNDQRAAFQQFVAEPGTRYVNLTGTDGGTVTVAYRSGESRGWIVGTNVPAAPDGKVYELWAKPGAGQPMQPAGLFVPSDGNVLAPATVAGSFTVLAVSTEPPGGSRRPTSQPVYVGQPA